MSDILIHASNISTLRERTKLILQTLRNAGAKLNVEKCESEFQKVRYLGHNLNSDGTIIDPEKVDNYFQFQITCTACNIKNLVSPHLTFRTFDCYQAFIQAWGREYFKI